MSICEETQVHLSALLDGEADPDDLLCATDHLTECSACQQFYRQVRRLDEFVTNAPDAFIAVAPATQKRGSFNRRWLSQPAFRWAAAAAVIALIVVGVWQPDLRWPTDDRAQAFDATDLVLITLAEDRGHLTDERFVEMAVELLRADQRYRHKMTEILNQVEDRASAGRSEAEFASTRRLIPEGSDDTREPFRSESAFAQSDPPEIL